MLIICSDQHLHKLLQLLVIRRNAYLGSNKYLMHNVALERLIRCLLFIYVFSDVMYEHELYFGGEGE